MSGAPNILARVPLAWQHRGDLLSRDQRKKVNLLVRLAKAQGGVRCSNGYVVPCIYCQWWLPLERATIEHLVNRSDGGTNDHANLALACYGCNNGRRAREGRSERRYGLTKFVRRRLRLFRMDVSPDRIQVTVRDHRIRLKPLHTHNCGLRG